ncbi:hypothetical protein Q3H59_004262 [Pantoea sp. SORGH_AS 659]|nr:hypothetical protein [Pantoea sp. SORGH_AS_0659]
MPNWCANRLRVSGPENHVKNARLLIEGGERVPHYARAAAEGIQLFLAGCAGLLRPVEATDYAPYPALVKGTGSVTPQNRAFTQWVSGLFTNRDDPFKNQNYLLLKLRYYLPLKLKPIRLRPVDNLMPALAANSRSRRFGTAASRQG